MKKTATLIMLTLQELGGKRSADCVAQFLYEDPDSVKTELEKLVLSGNVQMQELHEQKCYSILIPLESVALEMAYTSESWKEQEEIFLFFHAKDTYDVLFVCTALLDRMDRYLSTSATLGAVTCLELLLRYLKAWIKNIPNMNDIPRFLEIVLNVSDIAMYLTKHLEQTLELVIEARLLAKDLGDKNIIILLAFVEICLENMHAECSARRLQELRAQWPKVLAELKSTEAVSRLQYFLGMFHFWEGNFIEVLDSFAHNITPPRMWRGLFQTQMFPLYTSSSALYLGRFHQSVGILESARRTAELQHDRFKILWWEAQLAMVLLYMNQEDTALELLDHVIAQAHPESETKIYAWGMRGLAYFHWREGNIGAAYHVMRNALETTQKNAIGRLIYSYPWMLDMLYTFYKKGYAPLEGALLEDELVYALEGPNKHLQASALRTLGRIQLDAGHAVNEVLVYFEQSLLLFEAVNNPLEVARTHSCIAHCFFLMGKEHESQSLQQKAKKLLGQYGQNDEQSLDELLLGQGEPLCTSMAALYEKVATMCPVSFSQQEKKNDSYTTFVASRENPVKNCQIALEALPSTFSGKLFFKHVTRIACTELGAERAILFHVHRGGAVQAKARANITRHELNTGVHATKLSRIYSGLGTKAVILEEDSVVSIVMPLKIVKSESWFLYLESRYAVKALQALSAAQLEEIVTVFSRELYAALRYFGEKTKESKAPERSPVQPNKTTDILLHSAPNMRQLVSKSRQVATTNAPVLILGETGAGKELLAQFIHECSGRTGICVPVHPASISENLFESEFFGHEKGAFTGAIKDKIGLVEMAHEGTLFIDEVGDIPPSIQTKLLRVLQDQCFTRVGGNTPLRSDFRLVGATHKNLWDEIRAGRFREDLYFRMSVVPLSLPALRERKEDILLLTEFFLDKFSKQYQRHVPKLSESNKDFLLQHTWPGNVRELKSALERAVILYRSGETELNLCPHSSTAQVQQKSSHQISNEIMESLPTMEELQRKYVRFVLQQTGGKITGAQGALEILGIKRSTFYAKFRQEIMGE